MALASASVSMMRQICGHYSGPSSAYVSEAPRNLSPYIGAGVALSPFESGISERAFYDSYNTLVEFL
jgi:hypothetical protein